MHGYVSQVAFFFYIKQFSVEVTAPLILGDILAAKDVATHGPCPRNDVEKCCREVLERSVIEKCWSS